MNQQILQQSNNSRGHSGFLPAGEMPFISANTTRDPTMAGVTLPGAGVSGEGQNTAGMGLTMEAQDGMIFPSVTPTQQVVPDQPDASMFYFNPSAVGYNDSSRGFDPRQGYPLVYPYVPLPVPGKEGKPLKKKKAACC
eukprot:GHVT01068088.1.p1 GENE.GHVT01068088.1~~GHVT01068088.1.p1  ORF type:complete len:138 (+),score=21.72 GHVT01068088.1:509-922(+)